MKLEINTKEDSHDEIRKVIKMLQHIVGDSSEVFTNQPIVSTAAETSQNAFVNMFGDSSTPAASESVSAETQPVPEITEAKSSDSTEDLFAELFSPEEIQKMDTKPEDEDDEEEAQVKSKAKNVI